MAEVETYRVVRSNERWSGSMYLMKIALSASGSVSAQWWSYRPEEALPLSEVDAARLLVKLRDPFAETLGQSFQLELHGEPAEDLAETVE